MTSVWLLCCLAQSAAGTDSEEIQGPPVLFPGLTERAASLRDEDASLPDVGSLMDSVVSAFPREPLEIHGSFLVRRRRGVPVDERAFSMVVDWGSNPSTARYLIMDEAGRRPVKEMSITRSRGRSPVWRFRSGIPLEDRPLPNLFGSILGSDMSWMDLSLSFLWWPGGRIVGEDRVRGYACHVVEIPAPTVSGEKTDTAQTAYASVRLWIEKNQRMLLQAEGLDADGAVLRRLWIRSLQKIDERWMIKDMEVQRYPAVHRTRLTIREVSEVATP